jgi:hypothetical protein
MIMACMCKAEANRQHRPRRALNLLPALRAVKNASDRFQIQHSAWSRKHKQKPAKGCLIHHVDGLGQARPANDLPDSNACCWAKLNS